MLDTLKSSVKRYMWALPLVFSVFEWKYCKYFTWLLWVKNVWHSGLSNIFLQYMIGYLMLDGGYWWWGISPGFLQSYTSKWLHFWRRQQTNNLSFCFNVPKTLSWTLILILPTCCLSWTVCFAFSFPIAILDFLLPLFFRVLVNKVQ